MHEVKVTLPEKDIEEVVRLSKLAGIREVCVGSVFVHGPNEHRSQLSVDTSTPKAKAFIDAIQTSPVLAPSDYTLTSREVRAIISRESAESVTRPLSEPFPDVMQDLWQLSHITSSYVARAIGGAAILATGIIENNPISILVAALFLPFLSQVLAVSFGVWARDTRLVIHGLKALLLSVILAVSASAVVACFETGPIRFDGFRSAMASLVLAAIVGVTAGLSSADDTGRRYLIGVAASVQVATFPVWLGAALVLGMPDRATTLSRLTGFLLTVLVIGSTAALAYACLHLKNRRGQS